MKIGTEINLTGQWRNEEDPFNYRCNIIDMEQDVLYIDYPVNIETSRTVFLPLNEPFYVSFIKGTAVYQFESEVVERVKKVVPALKITVPSKEKFRKIQRRSYVRVETTADISIHCPEESFSPFTTVTKDLSGGGARLVIPNSLSNVQFIDDQKLLVYLVLRFSPEQYEYIETSARVVRINDAVNPLEVSIAFQLENRHDEEKIIQYCFQVQREARQK